MHVRDQVAYQFVNRVKPFLFDCEIYAAEMHLGEVDQMVMLQAKVLPDQGTLQNYMSENNYLRLERILWKSFGIDTRRFLRLHPFLLSAMISETLLRNDYEVSLDEYLWQLAQQEGKKLAGIESFAYQIEVMSALPIEVAVKQLRQLARRPQTLRRQIRKLSQYYEAQDINRIYQASRQQLQGLRKKLLFDRNWAMANQLKKLAQEGRVFAAIGAAHLAGAKGVLRHLKKLGCEVSPIGIYQ